MTWFLFHFVFNKVAKLDDIFKYRKYIYINLLGKAKITNDAVLSLTVMLIIHAIIKRSICKFSRNTDIKSSRM